VSDAIFLTGGTGFLGMELVARLLEHDDGPDIFVAVRAGDDGEARERVEALLRRLYETPPESAHRLRPVRAELTAPGLGMSARDRHDVAREVGRIVHCAASISFTLPVPEARAINVDGTRRVLALAREVRDLDRVVHVSTAYACGRGPEHFRERDLGGRDFRNSYEKTKLEAEIAVAAAGDLPIVVVRPSIVVGESDSGWTSAFNVLYWPMRAFARGLLDAIPADPDGVVDLVPVDFVAALLERATLEPGVRGTFHAVAGEQAMSVRELVEQVCAHMDRPAPELTAPGTLPRDHPAAVFAPYFDVRTRFGNRRALLLMNESRAPSPQEYLPRLIDYAVRAGWGRRDLSREAARAALATR